MCQLLGMSSNRAAAITFSFTGFAERGGRTADHVDGWGIAFYEPTGCRVFHDDQPACDSPLAQFVRSQPIKSRIVLSHVRKATQGAVSLANCHPFQREWLGQTWVFATNGDLRDFQPVLPGPYRPVGSTDSEKAFCWIMQCLLERFADRVAPPSWPELAPHLVELVADVARHGNFNVLMTNGDVLFAHCSSKLQWLQRRAPFSKASLVDCDLSVDLGELNSPDDRMIIVATEPLTEDEPWTPLQTGELLVMKDGEVVWRHIDPCTRVFPVPTACVGRAWSKTAFSESAAP
jgi:glutamine amidotransferase